ncbi:MAG: phosphatase PAP2 family protein [Ignavibacteriales bacterium]|nr:phosphatase PAP2 family protein [Ignavibacteriales bacterium]
MNSHFYCPLIKSFSICFTALLLNSSVPAQTNTRDSSQFPSIFNIFLDDVKVGLSDAGSYYSIPFRLSKTDWIYTVGLIGLNTLLITFDDDIKQLVDKDTKRSLAGDYLEVPIRYGQIECADILSIGTYATGLFLKNDDVRITGRLLFESLSFAGTVIIVSRAIAGRSRPFVTNNPWEFKGFQWRFRSQAFPSGHTTVAFSISTILAERIDNIWARIGFYGLASLDAFAQVYNNQHWLSDVVVCAALGIGTSFYILSLDENRKNKKSLNIFKLTIIPTLNSIKVIYHLE